MDEIRQFFFCDCGGEAVSVSAWNWHGELENVCLSWWGAGKNWGSGWRGKLAHIWHILKYGHPYLDDILLTPEKARELGEKLIELAEGA